MTREQVQRAVFRAAEEAFKIGERQRPGRSNGGEPLAAALQYADMLVMPMVDLALEQAREETATAMLEQRLDPEPGADAPA